MSTKRIPLVHVTTELSSRHFENSKYDDHCLVLIFHEEKVFMKYTEGFDEQCKIAGRMVHGSISILVNSTKEDVALLVANYFANLHAIMAKRPRADDVCDPAPISYRGTFKSVIEQVNIYCSGHNLPMMNRMEPITKEFVKEHKNDIYRACACCGKEVDGDTMRCDEKHTAHVTPHKRGSIKKKHIK